MIKMSNELVGYVILVIAITFYYNNNSIPRYL